MRISCSSRTKGSLRLRGSLKAPEPVVRHTVRWLSPLQEPVVLHAVRGTYGTPEAGYAHPPYVRHGCGTLWRCMSTRARARLRTRAVGAVELSHVMPRAPDLPGTRVMTCRAG